MLVEKEIIVLLNKIGLQRWCQNVYQKKYVKELVILIIYLPVNMANCKKQIKWRLLYV